MIQDDNSEVQELERRYPGGSVLLDAIVGLGYFSALIVICGGAVGAGVIIAHFIIKAW